MEEKKRTPAVRVLAIIAIILLAGMYIVSMIAAVSDWEYSKEILLASVAATIFIPITIYVIQLFAKMAVDRREKKKKDN